MSYIKWGFKQMNGSNKKAYQKGLRLGIPIGMGYFSVSFAFGMGAVNSGLSPLVAILISMTNLTSAGQFAGVNVILAQGGYIEMILTMLMINARYFLMSLSLSQRISQKLNRLQRSLMAFAITDEIFAVAAMQTETISGWFWLGLMTVPYIGWSGGTIIGALVSGVLPHSLGDALGIALYGMFIAIIIPAAKHSKAIMGTVMLAVLGSCTMYYIPLLKQISSGFAIIIVTIVVSGVMAYIAPIHQEERQEESCISS